MQGGAIGIVGNMAHPIRRRYLKPTRCCGAIFVAYNTA